jgi:hypothetical protein
MTLEKCFKKLKARLDTKRIDLDIQTTPPVPKELLVCPGFRRLIKSFPLTDLFVNNKNRPAPKALDGFSCLEVKPRDTGETYLYTSWSPIARKLHTVFESRENTIRYL